MPTNKPEAALTSEPDAELTVALAEYEHLREVRRAISDQSTARFNFFLVVASAGTAVSAGLVTAGVRVSGSRVGTVVAIGTLVLLLGVAVFVRQVEYNGRSRRYAVAMTALRTYFVRRHPELSPYVLLPTLDDPGPFASEPFRRHWIRDAVGLAGTVGLMNSALMGVAAGMALGRTAHWAVAAAAGGVLVVASLAAHVAYVRRKLAASAGQIGDVLSRRTLAGPTAPAPGPTAPAPGPAGAEPAQAKAARPAG
ncbi:MAG TPA: hypothetical protein VFR67_25985 [Pilimelia sp.]|nr:hypothetical protein [Pilimelia sp.]